MYDPANEQQRTDRFPLTLIVILGRNADRELTSLQFALPTLITTGGCFVFVTTTWQIDGGTHVGRESFELRPRNIAVLYLLRSPCIFLVPERQALSHAYRKETNTTARRIGQISLNRYLPGIFFPCLRLSLWDFQ